MEKDKIYHFVVGILIVTIINIFTCDLLLGLGLTILAGALKEVYDKISGKGTCEVLDAIATIFGGGIACGVIYYLVQ